VNAYLDESHAMPEVLPGCSRLFTVALVLFLYRSVRTLLAFVVTLAVWSRARSGTSVYGGTFTLVSPMVLMTVLVTAL
jgi:hypothetical protein